MLNFTHGVASGDPYPNSVILWTRLAPMFDNDDSNVTVSGFVPLYNHDTSEYVAMSSKSEGTSERGLTELTKERLSRVCCMGRGHW